MRHHKLKSNDLGCVIVVVVVVVVLAKGRRASTSKEFCLMYLYYKWRLDCGVFSAYRIDQFEPLLSEPHT